MDTDGPDQYQDKHKGVQKQNSCLNLAASPELPYTTIFSPEGLLSMLADNQKNEVEVAVHKGRKRKRSSFVQELDLDPEPPTKIRREGLAIAKRIRSIPEKRPPVEFALSIDEILGEIMTSLNTADLYSCRLVSNHWKKVASTKLWKQKQIAINLVYQPKDRTWFKGVYTNNKGWIPAHSLDKTWKLKLQDLTFLLKSWDTSGFPCRQFQIINGSLSNNALQSFFNTFGKYIKNLTFHFLNSSRRVKELVLLNHIEHLLTVQTKNLESLTLRLNFLVNCQDDNDNDGHGLLKPSSRRLGPEFHKIPDLIHGKSKITKKGINNEKLKFFDFGPLASKKILDTVIRISPNLEDVSLHFSDYHFFLQPLNQLHLLKRFDFGVDTQANSIENTENFKLIETALDSRTLSRPIKFSKLSIDFCLLLDRMEREEEFRLCVVNVINMILQLSWDSLESIVFLDYGLNILRGIKWPVTMSNVVEIGLCPFDTCGLEIFSSHLNCSFQMQHTFPRLQSLRMDVTRGDITSVSADYLEFEKKYNFGPVSSVKFLDVQVLDSFNDNSNFDEMGQRIFNFPDKFSRSLRSMFPDASFKDSNLELFPETPVKFKSEVVDTSKF